MLYSEKIRQAMTLCFQAHAGQVDKGGYPYAAHPLHLAEQMTSEPAVIVALLHDVVEDTEITLAELARMGFSSEVVGAVDALTHREGESYEAYIERIAACPLARQVKLVDLIHNMDLTRRPQVTEKARQKAAYYQHMYDLLRDRD